MKTKLFILVLSAALISFISCQKNNPIDQTSADLADDNSVTDVIFDDVFNTADNASLMLEEVLGNGSLKSATVFSDSCPLVTVTNPPEGVWPKTITVDYGTGCEGFFGSTRSGKIIITVTDRRNVVNATRTVTFENYYFNGIKVEGVKEVKNLGLNNNGNMTISDKLTGGKLTLPDNKTIERSFEHQREWIAGWATKNIWDDECLVTGSATGKNINGLSYTNTIMTALHWKRVCEFMVSGIIRFEREGVEAFEMDYGDGTCDAIATLKRGDQTKQITLRHRHRLHQ